MSEHKEYAALLGYSGHALVVAEAALSNATRLKGYLELEPKQENPYQLDFLGREVDLISPETSGFDQILLGIGDNVIRRNSAQLLRTKGFKISSVVHRDSLVSDMAIIHAGAFVARGAIINPLAEVGQDAIINSGAIIEHGVVVGSGSHIAPGAVICGEVLIGEMCFIGAGAVIKQGVKIGDGAVIGGGGVVLSDVPTKERWIGVPAMKKP